jgi:hypothetical protein
VEVPVHFLKRTLLKEWNFLFIMTFTLRERHGLRMFENGVLRRIFGLQREEVAGGWKNAQ